jgi:hypothetical protein
MFNSKSIRSSIYNTHKFTPTPINSLRPVPSLTQFIKSRNGYDGQWGDCDELEDSIELFYNSQNSPHKVTHSPILSYTDGDTIISPSLSLGVTIKSIHGDVVLKSKTYNLYSSLALLSLNYLNNNIISGTHTYSLGNNYLQVPTHNSSHARVSILSANVFNKDSHCGQLLTSYKSDPNWWQDTSALRLMHDVYHNSSPPGSVMNVDGSLRGTLNGMKLKLLLFPQQFGAITTQSDMTYSLMMFDRMGVSATTPQTINHVYDRAYNIANLPNIFDIFTQIHSYVVDNNNAQNSNSNSNNNNDNTALFFNSLNFFAQDLSFYDLYRPLLQLIRVYPDYDEISIIKAYIKHLLVYNIKPCEVSFERLAPSTSQLSPFESRFIQDLISINTRNYAVLGEIHHLKNENYKNEQHFVNLFLQLDVTLPIIDDILQIFITNNHTATNPGDVNQNESNQSWLLSPTRLISTLSNFFVASDGA